MILEHTAPPLPQTYTYISPTPLLCTPASIHEPCGHAQCILQSAGYHAALIVLSLDLGKHTMPVRPVVTQGPGGQPGQWHSC
eukprot:94843-Pelagomonas_calceolata.AAC.3